MRAVVLTALLIALPLAGCIADEPDDPPLPAGDEPPADVNNTTNELVPLSLEVGLTGIYPANPAYDPATITVDNGTLLTVVFTNSDLNPLGSHDWALEGYEDTAKTDVIGVGETAEVTFEVPEPGTYAFYCSIPGHRGFGMEGSFVVV